MTENTERTFFEKLADGDGGQLPTKGMTHAVHIGESDLPFVDLGDGSKIQLLHVDLRQGLWVVRTIFEPGYQVEKHYHTGPVFAVTHSGSWYYKEYPEQVNTKGSYMFEPAHSVHTLTITEGGNEPTDVWFAIYGANIHVDEKGDVTSVLDAQSVLEMYRALCTAEGKNCDKLLVVQ